MTKRVNGRFITSEEKVVKFTGKTVEEITEKLRNWIAENPKAAITSQKVVNNSKKDIKALLVAYLGSSNSS